MLATIFQLTGALILANLFVSYRSLTVPVAGKKPDELLNFFKNQVSSTIACLYLIIGYFIPLLDMDVNKGDYGKICIISITISGMILLFIIWYIVSWRLAKTFYNRSPVFEPYEIHQYSIWKMLHDWLRNVS